MKNFMMVLLILVGTQAQAEVKMATIDPGPFIATLYVPVAVSKLSPSASIIKLYTGMSSYVDEALIAAREACLSDGKAEELCHNSVKKIQSLSTQRVVQ